MDNQAAIRRSLSPAATAGQHLAIRIINNLSDILQARPNIKINIQWVPGHTEVAGNEIADKCAKDATGLPGRCPDSFTSLSYIKRQIQKMSLREWQQIWTTTAKGQEYRNTAQRQRDWGPSWKPTKLITGSDQTTASTIHQLRLGHGYFRSFLIRLPSYDSTQCQCSERVQNVKHLLLGCRLYQDERRHAGITRETTLHSLLFTPRGVTALQDFIQRTGVATRQWLLQRTDGREGGDEWGWGRLREDPEEYSVGR